LLEAAFQVQTRAAAFGGFGAVAVVDAQSHASARILK
jgi:hypothetical protein